MNVEDELRVWKIFSFLWTETGLIEDDINSQLKKLPLNQISIKDVKKIVYCRILWGFVWWSLSFLAVVIPIIGGCVVSSFMPDYEVSDIWLEKKYHHVKKWKLFYMLCPIIWVGWLIGYLMCRNTIKNIHLQIVKETMGKTKF